MLHCVANGHEILALANLRPPASAETDELDSFLYQTVGHDIIQYYAECMHLPLYRREISGDSVITGIDYHVTHGDETEDLYALLKDVKERHPNIQGVSVGAILSNYQRVRVENVCGRLGLTSLAYLWRRDQKELLNEMIQAGVHAILIKVAAIGLKPLNLGKSLAEMYPYLCAMNEKYDVHICGEGGEYETFTLDCPLFAKRLVVEEAETISHSDDAFAPVSYLRVKKVSLQEKVRPDIVSNSLVKIPSWEENIKETLSFIKSLALEDPQQIFSSDLPKISFDIEDDTINKSNFFDTHRNPPFFAISGTTAYSANDFSPLSRFETIEEETEACMLNLQTRLSELGLGWSDVVSMNVYVTDMNQFTKMNAVYKTFFDINPATRACVGANLPSPANIQIDLTAIKSTNKETMHVQSISYWAPANIGPYSQAIITHNHAYIAGQIGLIPASLDLPPLRSSESSPTLGSDFQKALSLQTALSLQNLESITSVLELDVRRHTAMCICYVDNEHSFSSVERTWDLFENSSKKTPVLYVAVPSLPRAAKVEWHVLVHSSGRDSQSLRFENYSRSNASGSNGSNIGEPIVYKNTNTHSETILTIAKSWILSPIFTSVVTLKLTSSFSDIPLSVLVETLVLAISNAVEGCRPNHDPTNPWSNIISIRIFYSEKFIEQTDTHTGILKKAIKLCLQERILEVNDNESTNFSNSFPAITIIPVLAIMDNNIFGACLHGLYNIRSHE